MENSYSAPGSELAATKPKPWGKWIAFGCLGAVVFILLLGVSCFFLFKGAMKAGSNEFGPACSQYLAKLESKDFSGAYALMGDEGKKELSEEQHNKLMKGIMEKLGSIESMDVQSVFTGVNQNGHWGRIVYTTKFKNGPGTIQFELVKTSGEYRVIGVFFRSKVLTDYVNKTLSN